MRIGSGRATPSENFGEIAPSEWFGPCKKQQLIFHDAGLFICVLTWESKKRSPEF
jgi:hypothetical protein